MSAKEAVVDVLTAEVRALMVGSRQVTLSVYRQLDIVGHGQCEPFGRVRDNKDPGGVWVVGRDVATGVLVRSCRHLPQSDFIAPVGGWCELGQNRDSSGFRHSDPRRARIAEDGDYEMYWMIGDGSAVNNYSRQDESIPPGGWRFASDRHASLAQEFAAVRLPALAATQKLHDEWLALPLIVLAGLR